MGDHSAKGVPPLVWVGVGAAGAMMFAIGLAAIFVVIPGMRAPVVPVAAPDAGNGVMPRLEQDIGKEKAAARQFVIETSGPDEILEVEGPVTIDLIPPKSFGNELGGILDAAEGRKPNRPRAKAAVRVRYRVLTAPGRGVHDVVVYLDANHKPIDMIATESVGGRVGWREEIHNYGEGP